MNNFSRTSSSSRYVIGDDFVPKVTVDGESHEFMIIIAGITGMLTAAIVLFIVVFIIDYKHSENYEQSGKKADASNSFNDIDKNKSQNISIISKFPRLKTDNEPQLTSIKISMNESLRYTNFTYNLNSSNHQLLQLPEITSGKF